jgi:fructose-specific phosphotransferase system IIC component
MSEPATPLLATGGLTLFGLATGLHPMLLVAGFVGCWWYNSYLDQMTLGQRIASGFIAALVSGWLTPPIVTWLTGLSWWPDTVPALTAGFPAALAIGFLTHKVIGPQLLRIAQKKAEEIA